MSNNMVKSEMSKILKKANIGNHWWSRKPSLA